MSRRSVRVTRDIHARGLGLGLIGVDGGCRAKGARLSGTRCHLGRQMNPGRVTSTRSDELMKEVCVEFDVMLRM
jgi:hypothetical protein